MEDNGRARAYRHILNQMKGIKRPHKDACIVANMIGRMVDKDIRAMCPDNAEEIFAKMDIADGILNFNMDNLRYLLDRAHEVNLYLDGCQSLLYGEEDLKESLINLRLDIIGWVKKFEGPERPKPTEAEEEAAEAERIETYRTCGLGPPESPLREAEA